MRKIIKFTSIMYSIVLTTSVYAYEASPGVKVSAPRITSQGFKNFHVESFPSKKNALSPKVVDVRATTSDVSGRVGDNLTVKSWHNIGISNYTKQYQRYTYTYTLICENFRGTYSRDVDLPPNTNFNDSSESNGTVQEDRIGTYPIRAATQISGSESGFHDANAVLRIRD